MVNLNDRLWWFCVLQKFGVLPMKVMLSIVFMVVSFVDVLLVIRKSDDQMK